MSHVFRGLVAEADLPPVRFHDLRHGAATLSLAAGNDLKTVQAMLGHASFVLTADTRRPSRRSVAAVRGGGHCRNATSESIASSAPGWRFSGVTETSGDQMINKGR